MPPKITIKRRPPSGEKSCKFYLPEDLDNYIRKTAITKYRTYTGQVEAMLQHGRKAGV